MRFGIEERWFRLKARELRKWNEACTFGSEEIRALQKVFQSMDQRPKIRVECVRGLTLHPQNVEEVTEISNVGRTEINAITFSSPYGSSPDAEITFDRVDSPSIRLDISGDDADVSRVGLEFERVVEQCRSWHWPTAKLQPMLFTVMLPMTFLLAATFVIAIHIKGSFAISVASGSVLLIMWIVFSKLFFPRCIFVIGKGADAIRVYSARRTQLFSGVGLTLVVGIILAFIVHRIGW